MAGQREGRAYMKKVAKVKKNGRDEKNVLKSKRKS